MRGFFLCLLALGVFIAVSLVVLPSFVSSDWMRAELARQLSSATGSSIALNGPVRLSVVPHLAVVAEDVSLDAEGVTAKIGEIAGSVTFPSLWSDRLHVREVRLARPDITVRQTPDTTTDAAAETQGGGQTQAKAGDPLAVLVAFLERSAIDSISITEGTLRQEDAAGAAQVLTDLDLTLAVPDIDGELSLSAGAGVEGRRYEVTLTVSPLRPLLERKPAELSFSLEADPALSPGLAELKASGQVALNANGSYQIRGGKLLLGEEALGLDALFIPGSRPRFLADLNADRLDFSAFVEGSTAASSQSAGQTGQSETPTGSAGLEALAGFDADISANVAALTLGDISASDVALTATLKDGLLTTRLDHLGIDAGNVAANLVADIRDDEPTFQGRVVSKGLDISRLAALAGQSVPLAGTLTMDTGFAFRGLSASALRKTINVTGSASLRDATFTVPGFADPSASEVKARTLALKIDGLAKPLRLAGNLSWRGKSADVDLQVPIHDLLSAKSGAGEIPLKLDLRMKEATLALDGKAALAGSYAGKASFAAADLRSLLAWVGQGGADSVDQFAFNGNVNAGPEGVAFQKATISVNGVEGSGNGAVQLGVPLKISGALHFKELDLARLAGAPSAAQRSKAKGSGGASGSAPDVPLDLSSLRSIDASIKVDAEKLGYGRVFAGPVATTIAVSEGVASLDVPESPFYGGQVAASLRADASGSEPSIALKASISGASSAPLLTDLANFKHLEGALQAQFDIAGAGSTTGALKRSLAGSANVRFSDGAIRGIDVADVYNNLVGLMSSGFKQNENKATGFTELGASFVIENGVARTEDIKLIGPLVRMSGSGEANVPDDQLNFRLDPRVVASLQGQGADIATEGIGVPVMVEGSFAAPRIYPDLSGLLKNPDAALATLKKFGLPADKLRLDELLSGEGKKGAIRDIISGAIGKPPKDQDNELSIEEIIGGGAPESGEAPPTSAAGGEATPDVATEQPAPEVVQPSQQQQPQAEPSKQEGGTLGKLFEFLQ
ncbi:MULTISPECIES: AsmA family protein [unclassified Ensifer]|uniref:AsmA family protein n=1 Tax=unclassified Ensifer TaxID=2633371 RepID=UPI00081372BE|nr:MULTISPECIES: AsmA family protein [unclassified Ensifer]OCP06532.1 membrane assembly protein AsmA [Ensifer sp. LC13]OCP06742.1 membrane assembly protein AsmA [Ensifer sp. LC14]OCP31229.1 membrane assembly protein AsmA [Ensifer sp. LC499]